MKENFKVKDFNIENTGGNIYVAYGIFEDGRFFSIGEETMYIYNKDESNPINYDNFDDYEWISKHFIDEYANIEGINKEYQYVLKQIWDKCTYSYKNELDLFESIEKEVK